MSNFHFANPELLALLVLIPIIAIWRGANGPDAAIQYSSMETLRFLGSPRRNRRGGWLTSFLLLSVFCFVIALARPRFDNSVEEVEASGIDIILAIDVSGSMETEDFMLNDAPISRLALARKVVDDFIKARPDDRIGIVAFAGKPYLLSPLTLDHGWLIFNLDRLKTRLVEDGTAIGSGLASSVNRLRKQESKSKIVILLTDGMNNSGKITPLTAAELAKAENIKVYTIGAGSQNEGTVQMRDAFGRVVNQKISSPIDEELMMRIATMTGGMFFRAADAQSLINIYKQIDTMEKTTRKMKRYEDYDEIYSWALIPGLILLLTGAFLEQTRFRKLP
ncbi:MAG: VWA domain-containing protein [Candidatus Methylacidiphilales bacterium]|nr:VWA domain-containing protein [Candidatus Methylacidiphilales bacterium]